MYHWQNFVTTCGSFLWTINHCTKFQIFTLEFRVYLYIISLIIPLLLVWSWNDITILLLMCCLNCHRSKLQQKTKKIMMLFSWHAFKVIGFIYYLIWKKYNKNIVKSAFIFVTGSFHPWFYYIVQSTYFFFL